MIEVFKFCLKINKFPNYWLVHSKDIESSVISIKKFISNILMIDLEQLDSCLDFKLVSSEVSSISIEQIRALSSFINETRALNKGKFIVIQEADKMTINSSNACLKLLEDSPSYLYVFLVSKNPYLLPLTVRSRCRKISDKTTAKKENFNHVSFTENQETINSERELIDFIDYLLLCINKIITENTIENDFLYNNIDKGATNLVDNFYYLSNIKKNIQTFHLDTKQSYFLIMEKLFKTKHS